jgi:SAM-dependent methyltransferase
MDYFLPEGYQSRLDPEYFVDEGYDGVWQPDVYPEAAALARRLGARCIVDVGCGTAQKLVALHPEFEIVGIDYGSNIAACRARYDVGTWLEIDLDRADSLGIEDFSDSLLVCADVIEHLVHPERLLRLLSDALDRGASAVVLSTPDREQSNGEPSLGPPKNPAHAREWTSRELERLFATFGLVGHFGRTRTNDVLPALRTILAILPGRSPEQRAVVADWFEDRRRWQRVPEEQDRSFAKYEAWVRELEEYNGWLTRERDVWEKRAHAAESRARELEAKLSVTSTLRGHVRRFLMRWRTRRE